MLMLLHFLPSECIHFVLCFLHIVHIEYVNVKRVGIERKFKFYALPLGFQFNTGNKIKNKL